MKKGTTLFLKMTICLIGLTIFACAIFWLPRLANDAANMNPEFSHLQYPVLIGMYVTIIPFSFALYQAFKLLLYIDRNDSFSVLSVKSLQLINQCAVTISVIYICGCIFLLSQNALHPGIALIGFIIIFTSIVIAVFAAVLQKLLKNAIDLKSENELTV